jgi:hypothetical protein
MINAADAARVRAAISLLTRDELQAHMENVITPQRPPASVQGYDKIAYLYDYGATMNVDTRQIFVCIARVTLGI